MGLAAVLAASCTNTKMMEFTYQELDTVKTQQQELLAQVHELSRLFEAERAARLRAEAEHAETLQQLRELVASMSYGAGPQSESRIGDPPADSNMAPAEGDSQAEKMFKNSYMDLTLGNYDLAIQGFKNFLARYPNSTNVAGAHYYLGESLYSVEKYADAVTEFQTVVREQSRSKYAAPAYLKSGFCYRQLGETDLAERAFRELISLYPRSEEAEQARLALQDQGG